MAYGQHITSSVSVLSVLKCHTDFFCICVTCLMQANRSVYKMAKVCSETSLSARQRLSTDDELAVIENGGSRSEILEEKLNMCALAFNFYDNIWIFYPFYCILTIIMNVFQDPV